MLVLSRKKNQAIMIGGDIEIFLIDILGDQVKIGIKAPRDTAVYRKELYEEIVKENRQARAAGINRQILKKDVLRIKRLDIENVNGEIKEKKGNNEDDA